MKTNHLFLVGIILFLVSCKSDNSGKGAISGTQSEMGKTGAVFSGTPSGINGVTACQASVVSSSGDISTINASATVTNSSILQILSNYPGDFTVNGNTVSLNGLQVKNLSGGIEKISGMNPGVIVNYSSSLNDTYPIGKGQTERKVTKINNTDSYSWGGMLIKIMEVTETIGQYGIKNIVYIANHKWGLVGILITFDDQSQIKFPINCNKNN